MVISDARPHCVYALKTKQQNNKRIIQALVETQMQPHNQPVTQLARQSKGWQHTQPRSEHTTQRRRNTFNMKQSRQKAGALCCSCARPFHEQASAVPAAALEKTEESTIWGFDSTTNKWKELSKDLRRWPSNRSNLLSYHHHHPRPHS